MTRARLAVLVGGIVLLLVAVFAGEYSTTDWLELRRRLAVERDTVRALRHAADSLRRVADALENDPTVQEREARERFGMIRDGEILYKIVPNQ